MFVRQIADETLAQYAYLIGCQQTGEALLIDPERDVERYRRLAAAAGFRIVAVAETHIHADFLSGVRELAARTPGLRVYLSGEGGPDWQYAWPDADGIRATLLRDGERFGIGNIELRAWHTPGHTPEHLSFIVVDHGAGATDPIALVSGDFVFVGDVGRPDLLESAAGVSGAAAEAAHELYDSATGLRRLADFVQIWPGHGAGSACGKSLGAVPTTTVGYERRYSRALAAHRRGESEFTRFVLDSQPEPPAYFGRMKRLNRIGPPLLAPEQRPREWTAAELRSRPAGTQVLDTRPDRHAFLSGHLPGSLFAPLDRTFPTVVGSLVDPELPLLLLVEPDSLDAALVQLQRIGFDRTIGWAPPAVIATLRRGEAPLAAIDSIDFAELARRRHRDQATVLDVRSAAEYGDGHLPGAINVPYTQLRTLEGRVHAACPDCHLYVHCASGARAAVSAAYLARHRRKVTHVDGDIEQAPDREGAAAGQGAA